MRSFLPVLVLTASSVWAQGGRPAITPEKIFEALGAREGQTLCEIGAGNGDMTLAAARLVGPTGRVFSSELGENRVKTLQDRVAASGLPHITVIAGDPAKTNFPDEACDAVFLKDVYHHFTEPAAMNLAIAAALKPGARVAIVDFTPPPGKEAARPAERGNDGTHGVTPASVIRELKDAGLEQVPMDAGGSDRWFLVVFSKPQR